jgi:hypothetical protein
MMKFYGMKSKITVANRHFELAEFSGIIISHQVFRCRKLSGYDFPAIKVA